MSFVVAAALGVVILALAPLLAHLLRRGQTREQEFPPAMLVPAAPTTAKQRRRLEDRALLGVRILIVVALAALGATPLASCERLTLARASGASVALALVVDDSHSMRARLEGGDTRWERALAGARELIASAREGDAVAIVLAGRPARVALAATTDLAAASDALGELRLSDRSTDLSAAVQLGRSVLRPLPHVDKRLTVLSDLADDPLPEGKPAAWAPLEEITVPVEDCAVLRAERLRTRVHVSVACTSAKAAEGRRLQLHPRSDAQEPLAETTLAPRAGEQESILESPKDSGELLAVTLAGKDARTNDSAPVTDRDDNLSVAVVADTATASATTGGPTILEQALNALSAPPTVRPLSVVPDEAASLKEFAALLLDDPAGFAPETRAALSAYVAHGGIAVAFLGPRAEAAQLASTLEPFARGAVRWESVRGLGVDAGSLSWLGSESQSLGELSRTGRARLDGAELEGAEVKGRWEDGRPFLLERALERGFVFSVGLPVSVEASDWALRPAFLAFLDHVMKLAHTRESPAITVAGKPWQFRGARKVVIEGPEGSLAVASGSDEVPRATPTVVGRYSLTVDGEMKERVVTLDAREVLARSVPAEREVGGTETSGRVGQVDISREVALIVLALFTAELLLRIFSRRMGSARPARTAAEPS